MLTKHDEVFVSKIGVVIQLKKQFKQRFKNFHAFSLQNKKRIDRSCFKKFNQPKLYTNEILEFSVTEKVSGEQLDRPTVF